MNYYDTYTGYVQPLQNNSSLNSFNTYRQYDEYCGTRQDDLVRFMYQNPSLVYSYDPWTNSVMVPPSSPKKDTSSEVKKKDTKPDVKKKDTKPDIKKKDVIPKIKKEESTSPPPSPTREKKRDVKPSRPPTTAVPTKFSWQKMFTNAWEFIKMPFEE